jgi:hypothetical protein
MKFNKDNGEFYDKDGHSLAMLLQPVDKVGIFTIRLMESPNSREGDNSLLENIQQMSDDAQKWREHKCECGEKGVNEIKLVVAQLADIIGRDVDAVNRMAKILEKLVTITVSQNKRLTELEDDKDYYRNDK